MGEFDLIKRYFDRPELRPGAAMALGPGDDCALLQVPAKHQ
ncbi:MAG TPA: thiamine-phosphate kinase, partial [Oceanospirillaceae bacterium]|nr:thiamine-phosphate kinase [Oceanospirillaceae bacterium]